MLELIPIERPRRPKAGPTLSGDEGVIIKRGLRWRSWGTAGAPKYLLW